MTPGIAIVGMACEYPDARSPNELWENVLAQRRAFRRIPRERLRREDYFSPDRTAPDRTYATEAALVEGYEFDRIGFRVAGSTFRSADLTHWLALDVAARALADAGFPLGEGMPRDMTGVLLGNTLTGDSSRANGVRLRWPYVRRTVEALLADEGRTREQRNTFLCDLEARYKAPFAPIGEETLAGSLSNTIAGRICNQFDLKGGGYTVDGACASSLLAVATACSALAAGDLDVALAGGVDLSIDPFELVGFAKAGALAADDMRVYDVRSAGFWPGEGCGILVLMRPDDAVAQRRRVYSVVRGWGVSSDGHGGITRPEVDGQILAIRRAYRRAGFDPATVAYFEGHGTGTEVGDDTELRVLARARREAGSFGLPAVVGSVKAIIGHTKAAAGVAGIIKATLALDRQILPPTTGCEQPHTELVGPDRALRALNRGEIWPANRPLRAGVSAMGFGGINTHVVLEGVATGRRVGVAPREQVLLASAQDAELILLSANDVGELRSRVDHLLGIAARLSRAELTDLAAQLERTLDDGPVRVAIVTTSPLDLEGQLSQLLSWLSAGLTRRLDVTAGVFVSQHAVAPRVGFLFPGQGSPVPSDAGALGRRFPDVEEAGGSPGSGPNVGLASVSITSTAVAQPALVASSLTGLRVLDRLGVVANLAVGHSLGELTAFHWAGTLDAAALLRIATARGKVMAEVDGPPGTMAAISASPAAIEALLVDEKRKGSTAVGIAGLNGPSQTVISGEATAVAEIVADARRRGWGARHLPVSHAFHSRLMDPAEPIFAEMLRSENFQRARHTVVSTVIGRPLALNDDLRDLLRRQLTVPVRFAEAIVHAAPFVDLFIEVGPGQVLTGLLAELDDTPTISLECGGPSLKGLLRAVGAAYSLGASVNHHALFADRFTRPFDLDWHPRFFASPCELAPVLDEGPPAENPPSVVEQPDPADAVTELGSPPVSAETTTLEVVRRLVAERAELPPSRVRDDDRLLGDLHLSSIAVGELVVKVTRLLGLPPPVAPTDFADATIVGVAQAIEEIARTGGTAVADRDATPSGVDSWIRAFTVELIERPRPVRPGPTEEGAWRVFAVQSDPLAPTLQRAFDAWGRGGGIVVSLPAGPDNACVSLLLEGVRGMLAENGPRRFVLVQHGGGAASLARTLFLEAPRLTVTVVDVPATHPRAVEWVLAEAAVAVGYSEAHYDVAGRRREALLRLLPDGEPTGFALTPHDVLLVTGGGKGIAAECALALARETGARLLLLGRSRPADDGELAENLDRLAAASVQFCYTSADVVDGDAVRAAVHEGEAVLGPVTAILHGAGANVPQLLSELDEPAFVRTLAPKVSGARNVLAAIDPTRLRLFVTFGSIIARTGLRGEADYAVANEWLTRLAEAFQEDHPRCRCLAVEWSIWSGVGMGQRLGRVDALARAGITPIPPEQGIAILRRLIEQPQRSVAVVVTGRYGDAPTLKREQPDLPFLRFLENPRVYYPGVELVVDVELSADSDPYLDDHVFQGERLLPAVIGIEAMAQVAMALAGVSAPPVFEQVEFNRPVVVSDTTVVARIAALVREPGRIDVVVRCDNTSFQVEHARATCRIGNQCMSDVSGPDLELPSESDANASGSSVLPLDPERDLYGGILFHRGRFRRLRGYRRLTATECIVEIASDEQATWFGRYLPTTLVLGDPAVRDAAIHAIQACFPHATLLPVGVDRVVTGVLQAPGPWTAHARERWRDGDAFCYDLEIVARDGTVCERWDGLRLRRVGTASLPAEWPAPLLRPYIERRLGDLIPGATISVSLERDEGVTRRLETDRAIRRTIGHSVAVVRRPDGKPEVGDGLAVSVAHAAGLTVVVAGPEPLGCDLEPVAERAVELWRDLLGPDRFDLAGIVAREGAEDMSTAATRVWAADESLKKAGAMPDTPLVFSMATEDGWVLLSAGGFKVATVAVTLQGKRARQVVAVLAAEQARAKVAQSS